MAQRKKNNETAVEAITPTTGDNGEQIVWVDLKDIDLTFENSRTGDFTVGDSEESGEGQSFADLVDSIKLGGQRTPGVARMKGKKYQLISGFRRYAAIKQINSAGGTALKMKLYVKNLDDLNAHIENVTENSRQDLSGPDLAFGLYKIAELSKARGNDMSDRALASMVGKNNGYVSQLLKIVRKAPKVAKLWHEADLQLGVRDMVKIANIEDPKLQLEKYNEILGGKQEDTETTGSGSGGKPWIQTAIGQGERIASILGALARRGCVKMTANFSWEEELETLGVRVKADANGRDRNRIAAKCRKAYQTALEAEEEESEEEAEEAAE